jgi:hypothetical protein
MLPLFVVLVWGSATSRPYADICAVILRIPRIISFANEDYPAPSYCGTPADFFILSENSVVSCLCCLTALQAAPLGFAEQHLQFVLSHLINVVSLPARVKTHVRLCCLKMAKCCLNVVSEIKIKSL